MLLYLRRDLNCENQHPSVGQVHSGKNSARPRLEFDYLVKRFLEVFSDGFEGTNFEAKERRYKKDASELLTRELGYAEFKHLIEAESYTNIWERAKSILRSTNLVFPQEKIWFCNGFETPELQRRFSVQLFDLLYGVRPLEQKFNEFCDVLLAGGACKWTIATYYQFLSSNGTQLFMKPEVTKRIAESLNFDLNYRPLPNWLTYSKLQELAARLDTELRNRNLCPASGMDIQGFIWTSVQIADGKYKTG